MLLFFLTQVFRSELVKLYLKQNIMPKSVVFSAKMLNGEYKVAYKFSRDGCQTKCALYPDPSTLCQQHCSCLFLHIFRHLIFRLDDKLLNMNVLKMVGSRLDDGGVQIIFQINIWNHIICTIFFFKFLLASTYPFLHCPIRKPALQIHVTIYFIQNNYPVLWLDRIILLIIGECTFLNWGCIVLSLIVNIIQDIYKIDSFFLSPHFFFCLTIVYQISRFIFVWQIFVTRNYETELHFASQWHI